MVSVSDVQAVYGEQEPAISASKQEELLNIAERMKDDVYGGRVSRFSEIEGNDDDFVRYLAAHLWEISEGGEVQSSQQTGGSVNYQHLQTNIESMLSETRYGRVALSMLRNSTSVSIVRSDR